MAYGPKSLPSTGNDVTELLQNIIFSDKNEVKSQ